MMNCENPVQMWRLPGINRLTGRLHPLRTSEYVKLHSGYNWQPDFSPCGKCFGCLKSKARDLTVRAYHEAKCHKYSSFVTLTVDDDHLEQVFPGGSLDHRPFQLFFKRLRKASRQPLRYLMCAEYGETTQRPHYHCVIFGLMPDDGRPVAVVKTDPLLGTVRTMYSGFCQSKLISDAWPFGHVYIGNVSPGSIAYVAGYTLKAYTLGRDDDWYKSRNLAPEYHKWSRRPGLGHLWMQRNIGDLWRNNQDLFEPLLVDNTAIFNGSRVPLPRAYRARLQYLDEHQDKSPIDPLQVRRKLDIMSVSLERQLVLADHPVTEHDWELMLQEQQVLKNRRDKQKYDVARRKRL